MIAPHDAMACTVDSRAIEIGGDAHAEQKLMDTCYSLDVRFALSHCSRLYSAEHGDEHHLVRDWEASLVLGDPDDGDFEVLGYSAGALFAGSLTNRHDGKDFADLHSASLGKLVANFFDDNWQLDRRLKCFGLDVVWVQSMAIASHLRGHDLSHDFMRAILLEFVPSPAIMVLQPGSLNRDSLPDEHAHLVAGLPTLDELHPSERRSSEAWRQSKRSLAAHWRRLGFKRHRGYMYFDCEAPMRSRPKKPKETL